MKFSQQETKNTFLLLNFLIPADSITYFPKTTVLFRVCMVKYKEKRILRRKG